jgi:hypothetical protein
MVIVRRWDPFPPKMLFRLGVGEIAVILLGDRVATAHLPLKYTPARLRDLKRAGTITRMTWLVK